MLALGLFAATAPEAQTVSGWRTCRVVSCRRIGGWGRPWMRILWQASASLRLPHAAGTQANIDGAGIASSSARVPRPSSQGFRAAAARQARQPIV